MAPHMHATNHYFAFREILLLMMAAILLAMSVGSRLMLAHIILVPNVT